MDSLRKFFDEVGLDSSSLDETIGDYVLELTRAGNDDAEVWSFLEGCYPELEEVSLRPLTLEAWSPTLDAM